MITNSGMPFDENNQKIVNAVSGVTGLDSVSAAALFLSEGRTMNAEEASIMNSAPTLELDGLTRAHLRRMMGFDFKVKLAGLKIHVYSKEGPHLSTHTRIKPGEMDEYGNITSEKLITRLSDACVRLKLKWDAEVMRREANMKRGGK